jgi:hypothetical protein
LSVRGRGEAGWDGTGSRAGGNWMVSARDVAGQCAAARRIGAKSRIGRGGEGVVGSVGDGRRGLGKTRCVGWEGGDAKRAGRGGRGWGARG